MTTTAKVRTYPSIDISEAPEQWLRAFLDNGDISQARYEEEIARRCGVVLPADPSKIVHHPV